MARYGITKPLGNIKPEAIFEASQAAFKDIGWEVYKMRSIAFLIEARTKRMMKVIFWPISSQLHLETLKLN